MTNEQLLMEIGRVMESTVRNAVQESEERMKLYVHDVVHNAIQASEKHMKLETERLSQQIQVVDARLSASIENLRDTVQQAMDDTENMARQIAATVVS